MWLGVETSLGLADVSVGEYEGIVVEVLLEFPELDLAEEITARDIFAASAAYTPLDARCRLKAVETGFALVTHLCTSTQIEETVGENIYTDLGVAGELGSYSMQSDPVEDEVYEIIVGLGHELAEGAVVVDVPVGSGATLTSNGANGSLDAVFGGTRESWDAAFGAPIDEGIDDFGYPYADYDSEFTILSVSFNPDSGVAEYVLIEVAGDGRAMAAIVADVLDVVASYDTCSAIVLDVAEAMYECQSSDLATILTQEDYDLAGSGSAVGVFMVLAGESEPGVVMIELSL